MARSTVLVVTLLTLVLASTLAVALPTPPVPTVTGPAGSADVMGQWETPFDGQAPAVNLVVLNDGRVLYWSGVEAGSRDGVFFTDAPMAGESRVWDPVTNAITTPSFSDGHAGDLFCSGQVIMPDGTVLTAGGSGWREITGSRRRSRRGLLSTSPRRRCSSSRSRPRATCMRWA